MGERFLTGVCILLCALQFYPVHTSLAGWRTSSPAPILGPMVCHPFCLLTELCLESIMLPGLILQRAACRKASRRTQTVGGL